MADEMCRAAPHKQFGHVGGIHLEVLVLDRRVRVVAAPIQHQQRPSLRQRSLPPPAHLTVRYAAVHQECGRPQLSPAMHVQLYRSLLIPRDTLQRIFPLLEGTSEGPTTFGRES